MNSSVERYPNYLVIVNDARECIPLALVPVTTPLPKLREAAQQRLSPIVFAFPDSAMTPIHVLRSLTNTQIIRMIRSATLQRVRLATSLEDVEPDEVGHRWFFDPNPILRPMDSAHGIVPVETPVTVRSREAKPTRFELDLPPLPTGGRGL